jgi:hypothetical protein
MTLTLPELTWIDGNLIPETRVMKGVPTQAIEEELGSRIRLGGPVSRPMERSGLEDERILSALQNESATAAYTLTDLAVSFDAAEGEVIEQVWVLLNLAGTDQPGPIAWSMLPERLSSPSETVGTVEVKADLKVFSVGTSASKQISGETVFLEAQNILRSDPTWEFYRSSQHEIRGSHRLLLVSRSAVGSEVTGTLSIIATVRRRVWGVFPYQVRLGDKTSTTFVVR